ncbi:MAG: TetR/AcrR family transcriptional regulator [Oscillospiraceae bacterium]|jgi:AcrR family transcriptional regulator|nr:TetR/AcrR family transcriptional regulator [Oscillospiraceae bacterium]
MSRVTKPVEERRQEIIDTAKKLFAENGFDKTQVADISANINVAQGLVYHYFKSKTDILYAVIDEIAAEQFARMAQKLEAHKGSALEGLTLLFQTRPDYDCNDKLIPSLKRDRALIDYCSKKMASSSFPLLLMLIEKGNADGSWSCEYPKETAIFILHGFSGLLGLSDAPIREEAKIQAFTNIIFRILGVESAPA